MSEDLTRNLPPPSFEERVLSELAAIRGGLTQQGVRLTSLEERVDARLRETRPIWEGVQQRLTNIEDALNELNRQLKTLITDSFKLRVRVEKLEDNQPTA
jgi:predicted nuclease with TOPRIM domain